MRFDVVTIFPDLLQSPLQEGILRRAIRDGKVEVFIHNLRNFATDRHAMTDDRPFGGGEGMVMKPEPIGAALEEIEHQAPGGKVVLLTPQGKKYDQGLARELAGREKHLILLCGRYEGVDDRIRKLYVDEEISIGDYVLSGGELAAMVLIDSISRLLPEVLGCAESAANDTFSRGLLKHPQYTRPQEYRSLTVPEVLLSGNHAAVAEFRFVASFRQTLRQRPDLLVQLELSESERRLLKKEGLLGAYERLRSPGSVEN